MIADPIMTALLQMFTSSTGQGGGVQEDALMAVGTLVEGTSIMFRALPRWKYVKLFLGLPVEGVSLGNLFVYLSINDSHR